MSLINLPTQSENINCVNKINFTLNDFRKKKSEKEVKKVISETIEQIAEKNVICQ